MYATISHGSRTDTTRQAAGQATGRKASTAPSTPAYDHWSVARNDDGTRLFHVRLPQLRTEISREIGRRCAESAWRGIWDLLREQERKGRTAAIREAAGRLCILDDTGVAGLARHTGKSRNTIYRQLAILEDIGLIRCVRPPVSMVRGPDGRLILKKGGRERPVRIVVTYDLDVHGKPRRKPARPADSYGQSLTIEPASSGASYGQPLNTFQRCFQTELPPDAETDGIGSAVAGEGEGGLPAAGQDEARQADPVPLADAMKSKRSFREDLSGRQADPVPLADAMAVLTNEILAGRKGLPAPSDPPHADRPAPRSRGTAGQEPPKDYAKIAADFYRPHPVVAATLADKAAAKAEREAAKAGTAGQAPESPSAPARPAGTIPRGQDEAPVRTPTPQVDADAAELAALVSNIRQAIGIGRQDAYREGWHADRAG